jgi:hypothetical protein
MTYLFMAILAVEGWRGPGTYGSHGERGPYQITYGYWQDAGMPSGDFASCDDAVYSRAVMRRYWKRHCPEALRDRDYRILAAVHHWGPQGFGNPASAGDDYVEQVMGSMKGAK